MSTGENIVEVRALSPRVALAVLPTVAAALFVSAFLLFSIQPMFAKLVLPKLGGTPAVWSMAMIFFQTVLLAGYAYAHLIATRFSPRRGALIHLSLMGLVLASALPIGLASGFERPPADGQAAWLIALFALSVGLPFFAVSANGPLLQAWFARTEHPHAADPYFLYGASNLGSFLALISYPLLIEPNLPLATQASAWTWGFAALMAGVAATAGFAVGRGGPSAARVGMHGADDDMAAPSWGRRAQWTAFAFVPSALLVAVTAYISTDVAAAPFLWVVPLALFLLTFIIVFQRRPIFSHARMLSFQAIVVALVLVPVAAGMHLSWQAMLPLHLGGFFLTAMVCHGELVRRRPAARHLTQFYMWMSFGGVLGGLFAGLVAPQIFSTILEYPLLLMAGLLCRPGLFEAGNRGPALRTIAVITGCAAVVAFVGYVAPDILPLRQFLTFKIGILVLACLVMFQFGHQPRLVGFAFAALLVLGVARQGADGAETVRSFYGVHKIALSSDGRYRTLSHGTTLHGAQEIRDAQGNLLQGPPEPIAYYHARGNISQAIEAIRAARGDMREVALVGIGTGSLACRRQAGETWTLYEIDAAIVDIARDPTRFGFLSHCAGDSRIVLGDARLTLADAPDGSIDLLVVDAFSSDAIPVHLMTREAVALYASKLSDRGAVVFHISNRNMELASVVAGVAQANGLKMVASVRLASTGEAERYRLPSEVAVLARSEADFGDLPSRPGWRLLAADARMRPWTDDYADVVSAIWRRLGPR